MLLLLLLVTLYGIVLYIYYVFLLYTQAALKYKLPAVAMAAAYSTAKLEQLW